MFLRQRPRRNRKSEVVRNLVSEHHLGVKDLIAPLFVQEGEGIKTSIASMPGQYRFSLDLLLEEIGELQHKGIDSVALFPCY